MKKKFKDKILPLDDNQDILKDGKMVHKFADYDDKFYHHKFAQGTELQWVLGEKEITSKVQRAEYNYAKEEEKRMKEEREKWFENHAARLEELDDQKLHNHIMEHMEKTDIDFKRALVEKNADDNPDYVQIEGKLVNNKRKGGKKKNDDKCEHSFDHPISFDHIHGGPKVKELQEEDEETLKLTDKEEQLKAIKKK